MIPSTHLAAVRSANQPFLEASEYPQGIPCEGRLAYLWSRYLAHAGVLKHCDVYVCERCVSRVVMSGHVYLYTDPGNRLEAEGPPRCN
jgi:hypothetical protein